MAATVVARPLRGSRLSSFYPEPPSEIPPINSLNSAFQIQEYISLLVRADPHNVDRIVELPSIPGSSSGVSINEGDLTSDKTAEDGDKDKEKSEAVVDEPCWIYEQLRRLAQDLTHPLITSLQQECTRSTCPQMKAGEWLYLCVAHGNEGATQQCCAIDYIVHTLDSATAVLNSPRAFPSRLSIAESSHRHFPSIARRLGRIFAHAYYHHRALFLAAEAQQSLYERFWKLTNRFNLVPKDFLVIPEGELGALLEGYPEDDEFVGRVVNDVEPKLGSAGVEGKGSGIGNQGRIGYSDTRERLRGEYAFDTDSSPFRQHAAFLSSSINQTQGHVNRGSEDDSEADLAPSARRFLGRNRTDTMIPSDAAAISAVFAGSNTRDAAEEDSSYEPPLPSTDEIERRLIGDPHERTYAFVTSELPHQPSSLASEEADAVPLQPDIQPELFEHTGNEDEQLEPGHPRALPSEGLPESSSLIVLVEPEETQTCANCGKLHANPETKPSSAQDLSEVDSTHRVDEDSIEAEAEENKGDRTEDIDIASLAKGDLESDNASSESIDAPTSELGTIEESEDDNSDLASTNFSGYTTAPTGSLIDISSPDDDTFQENAEIIKDPEIPFELKSTQNVETEETGDDVNESSDIDFEELDEVDIRSDAKSAAIIDPNITLEDDLTDVENVLKDSD